METSQDIQKNDVSWIEPGDDNVMCARRKNVQAVAVTGYGSRHSIRPRIKASGTPCDTPVFAALACYVCMPPVTRPFMLAQIWLQAVLPAFRMYLSSASKNGRRRKC